MILKRHGKKGKQQNDGGLNIEQSSCLKIFTQIKVKFLINGLLHLPIASKFNFVEKRFVHKNIRKVCIRKVSIQRCCVPKNVEYNTDQTPLPFVMDDGKTYADKRTSEVWRATHGLGPDKRQC